MRKRILSIVLCLSMALTLLPTAVFATEGTTITSPLDFTNVGNSGGQTPTTGAGYVWSGNETSGYKLELNGLVLTVTGATALTLPGNTELILKGENKITVEKVATNPWQFTSIYCKGALRITGSGNLTAVGTADGISGTGNATTPAVVFDSTGTIDITADKIGINAASGDLNVHSGTIVTHGQTNSGKGMYSFDSNICITGGDVTAIGDTGEGIYAYSETKNVAISITGGTVHATGKSFGIVAGTTQADACQPTITIGGTADVTAISSASGAIYATGNVSITGGKVNATAQEPGYPGIRSKRGNLIISGTAAVNAVSKAMGLYADVGGLEVKNTAVVTSAGDAVDAAVAVAPVVADTAELNALVRVTATAATAGRTFTAYGACQLRTDISLGATAYKGSHPQKLVVATGATLTVPAEKTITVTGMDYLELNGSLVNGGTINLPEGTTVDQIKSLRLTGLGTVKVGDKTYTNAGDEIHVSTTALDFTSAIENAGDLAANGYHWDNGSKTLTLKNLRLSVSNDPKAITLPDGAKLVLQGVSTVTGESSAIDVNGNLTVSGTDGILKVGRTSGASGNSIEVEETLTVDSGTILSAGNYASMYANAIEIKAGTIDLGAHGMMMVMTTLTISGGNVTTGDSVMYSMKAKKIVISGGNVTTGSGGDYSMCAKDIAISGGVVKTGAGIQSSIHAWDEHGAKASISITGGTVIANGDNHQRTSAGIFAMNGDISITGGTVSATGMHAAILAHGGTITDTGMTATTTPAGGKAMSTTVNMPSGEGNTTSITVTSYTADAKLNAGETGMVTNACTTVSLAKTQTPPDSGDSGSSSGGGTVTPPAPKPEPPKTDPGTGNTEVSVPVKPVTKGDTSSATVPEKAVSDAIAAAEKEAAKTGGSASVTVTVDAPKGAKTVETTLPSKTLSAVADGKTEGLKISTPVADLSFDSEALKNIAGMAGKDVKISATRVDAKALTDIQKSQVGDAPVFDFTVTSGGKTISNFNGGTATVSVPYTPKEGENPEFVTVWLLDDAGKLIPIEASYKDGKISFETGHFSRYAIGYLPFTDVKADWAYESIVYAYQNQLFSGVGGNKFAPTDNMNRAMLWTVLYRMAGSPDKTEAPANWYADAQAWAIAEKISDGTNPDGNITREQLATILWRYAQSKKQDVSIGEDTNILSYDDFDQMSQYAIPALQWACGAGVINGKSDSVLDPGGNATRAEVATMLQRFAGLSK